MEEKPHNLDSDWQIGLKNFSSDLYSFWLYYTF